MNTNARSNRSILRPGHAVTAALLLAATMSAAPAQAGTSANATTRSVVVKYGDLDLTKDAGAQVLYRRIHAAIAHVCGRAASTPYIAEKLQIRKCSEAAMTRAVQDVKSPAFASWYAKETGQSLEGGTLVAQGR